DRNLIWLERTKGVGLLSAADAIALGQSGPVLRASGVDWDLRRDQPYLAYDEVDFRIPVYPHGDVYDRYRVHMEEMRQSVRIVERRHDRDRRLPRHRHGGGRPVTSLYSEVQRLRTLYPESRSAIMPALRLAQERDGWLTPEALREVADALDLTPAYCKGV